MWNMREICDVAATSLSIIFKRSLELEEVSNKWNRENTTHKFKKEKKSIWATAGYLNPCVADGVIIC